MWKVVLDPERCTGCGECVDNCPGEVYEMRADRVVAAHPEECHGCHTCEAVCEAEACRVEEA